MVYYGVYPTVYLIVYHIWFTPVISENLPLKSRLAEEGEGFLISDMGVVRNALSETAKNDADMDI
jgi:hypothetical protein